jgi:glyoxylate reductase
MGRIGQAVARRGNAFGLRVLYTSRRAPPVAEPGWRMVPLSVLLSESDVVSLHVPLTPETHHLIGGRELASMKPSAYLINTARGPLVDEAALAEALRARTIAGAGLDVYEREPTIEPALLACKNALLLPHLGSATTMARERMGRMAVENLLAVLEGRKAPNAVDA